jgi:small subunit ribosomal protein S8
MADTLSNIFNIISIARKSGKQTCVVGPVSRFLVRILDIIKSNGYINKYEIISDSRGGFIKLELSENLNQCKAIRPRLPIKAEDVTKYEKRFLPSLGFGIIILSTSKGLMTNNEAKNAKIGGSLIAYVY